MDRAKIERIRNAVKQALKSVEAELDLTLKLGRCNFDPKGFAKFSLEASEQVGGEVDLPPDTPLERIVAVGVCVPRAKRGRRFVKGCPPNNSDIAKAILSAARARG